MASGRKLNLSSSGCAACEEEGSVTQYLNLQHFLLETTVFRKENNILEQTSNIHSINIQIFFSSGCFLGHVLTVTFPAVSLEVHNMTFKVNTPPWLSLWIQWGTKNYY